MALAKSEIYTVYVYIYKYMAFDGAKPQHYTRHKANYQEKLLNRGRKLQLSLGDMSRTNVGSGNATSEIM